MNKRIPLTGGFGGKRTFPSTSGGNMSGTGTPPHFAKFTAAHTVGDSIALETSNGINIPIADVVTYVGQNTSLLATPQQLVTVQGYGYNAALTNLIEYGEVGVESAFYDGDNGTGLISLSPAIEGTVVPVLQVSGDGSATGSFVRVLDTTGLNYFQVDSNTLSLTVGDIAAFAPAGLVNFISFESQASSQRLVTNVGHQTADSGTFTRLGHVYSRKDTGSLTDDGILGLVSGPGYIGYGHVWASTATGSDDHVNQMNFSWDSSGNVSVFNGVGLVDSADTDGKLCIYYNNGIKLKNRLGGTRTVGYCVDYYTDPDLVNGSWVASGPVKDWRAVEMSANGIYQTAVANNEYIYRTADSGATWTQVASVKPWYDVTMDDTGAIQYAIEGRDAPGGGYVWKSVDNGLTWAKLTDATINVARHYHKIKTDATGQYVVTMVNNGRIYYSSDAGVTWAVSNAPTANWQGMAMTSAGDILYATGYGSKNVYKSTNYGATWAVCCNTGTSRKWDSLGCDATGTYVMAGEEPGQLFRSIDSGATFTAVAAMGTRYFHEIGVDTTGQYMTLLEKHTTGVGIWGSIDYGASFTQYTSPPNAVWWGVAQKSDALRTVVGSLTPVYIYT